MVKISQKGDFKKLTKFFKRVSKAYDIGKFDIYGRQGVEALNKYTPVDTGVTANSWYYKVKRTQTGVILSFHNTNIKPGYAYGEEGVPIAIILQYGHATRNGGWVQGRDYINPALRPLFENIAKQMWEEVK